MLQNIQALNRQQRSNLLNKDIQAIDMAQNQLPFTTQRLEREMGAIKQEQAPKVEDFKEITPPEEETNFRQMAVENIKAQQATPEMKDDTQVAEPTTIEDIGVPSTDYQPMSDIAPQEGLSAVILKQAEQMAMQAGLLSQQAQVNQGLDSLVGNETALPQQTSQTTLQTPTQLPSTPTQALEQPATTPTTPTVQPAVQPAVQPKESMLPEDLSQQAGSKWQHGFQFKPRGKDDITGHCGWYAQQFTTLQDGSNWTIGSKISDKKKQFAEHVQKGDAFYLGKDVPQVGNAIIFNGGDWGHVAVISKINPDGTAVLDESNFNNDKRVTKNRVVKLSDPAIIGFMRTKVRK